MHACARPKILNEKPMRLRAEPAAAELLLHVYLRSPNDGVVRVDLGNKAVAAVW
jgi:hypothetical protein